MIIALSKTQEASDMYNSDFDFYDYEEDRVTEYIPLVPSIKTLFEFFGILAASLGLIYLFTCIFWLLGI